MNRYLRSLALALSVTLAPALSQEEVELQLDEPQVLEIRADDPVMTEGGGPSRVAIYVSDFTGRLYVWGTSDRSKPDRVKPVLRVERDFQTVTEDDGRGGQQDACAELRVRPGQEIWIIASSSAPEQLGDVELRLVAAPETPELLEAVAAAGELIAAAERSIESGQTDAARSSLALALDEVVRVEGASLFSLGRMKLGDQIGSKANQLGAYGTAVRAAHLLRTELERVLPPVHTLRAEALANEITVLNQQGEYQAAIQLAEGAVQVMEAVHGRDGVKTAEMKLVVAQSLAAINRNDEALALLESALEVCEAKSGAEAVFLAVLAKIGLAGAENQRGHPRRAVNHYEESLALLESVGQTNNPVFAVALSDLAGTKIGLGELDDVRELLERAVEINEGHPSIGRNHANTALNLINLGRASLALGEFEEAKEYLSECLEIRTTTLGPDHPKTGTTHSVFGDLYLEQGDYKAARAQFERARQIWRDAGDAREAWALDQLTRVCLELDEYAAMEGYLDEASQLREAIFGSEDHPEVSVALDLRGLMLIEQGDFAGARIALERSLDIRVRTLGDENAATARSRRNLGRLAQAEGGLQDAKTLLETALTVERSRFGVDSPTTAASQHALASIQLDRGKNINAMTNCEAALATRIERLGDAHADVGRSKHLLGRIMLTEEEFERAEAEVTVALDILTRALDENHLDAVACRATLAEIVVGLDEPQRARAVELLEGVLRVRLDKLGPEHVATLEARTKLAARLAEAGELERAREQYAELLRVQEQALDPDHEVLVETRRGLVQVLTGLGRTDEAASVREALDEGLGQDGESREHPPIVSPFGPAGLREEGPGRWTLEGEERRVTLKFSVADSVGVRDIQISRRGESIIASAEPGMLQLDMSGKSATISFPVTIPLDTNELVVTLEAENRRGVWSEPIRLTLKYMSATRDLYVVAIGVSDYEDPSLDLAFPQEDVADLVDRLQQERGRHYDEVHVQELVGQAVNSGALEAARRKFLRPAQPGDTILVFAAGHGVRWIDPEEEDGPAKYYFLTHAATPTEAWKGIKWDDLYELATKGGKAKRRVLLLDTCQSGGAQRGVGQDFVSDTKAKKLLLSGVYVLAASSRTGFAEEADGNGLFTRALLAGLGGDADLEANGGNFNGTIEIEELYEFTREMVLRESDGRQKPTLPLVEGGENFPLVMVPGD